MFTSIARRHRPTLKGFSHLAPLRWPLFVAVLVTAGSCALESRTYTPQGELQLMVKAESGDLREGQTIEIPVSITRGLGLDQDVVVNVVSPPPGLSADPVVVAAGTDTATLTLHADGAQLGVVATLMLAAASEGVTADASTRVFVLGKPGTIDTTFGSQGLLTLTESIAGRVKPTPQRGVLFVDSARLTRLTSDGQLDLTFGVGGILELRALSGLQQIPQFAPVIANYQRDGKLVIATSFDDPGTAEIPDGVLLARLAPDGALDPTYGVNGVVETPLLSYEVGKAGLSTENELAIWARSPSTNLFVLARYSASGVPTFAKVLSSDGDLGTVRAELFWQPDRKLLAAGSRVGLRFIARYTSTLVPDASFGAAGQLALGNQTPQLFATSDGGYLVTGATLLNNQLVATLWRFDAAWVPSVGYGASGLVFPSYMGFFVRALESDGKVTALAITDAVRVVRLLRGGALDPSFGSNGEAFVSYRMPNDFVVDMVPVDHSRALIVVRRFDTMRHDLYRIWY